MKKSKKLKHIIISLLSIFIITFSLYGCNNSDNNKENTQTEQQNKTITDMAGRKVEIKNEKIEKIYCTDPVSAITIYTINPELLLGWNYSFNDYEKEYILEEYQNLTAYGMGDKVNIEAIINDNPDIVIHMGNINEKFIESANKLSNQLNIPVIAVDGSLLKTPESYRFIGEIIGEEERTNLLASYCENTINDIIKTSENIETKHTIYYGNGADSLETAPFGSSASEVFDILSAENVVKIENDDNSTTQRIQITAEQLLTWNPEFIFVNGEPKENISGSKSVEEIMTNANYQNLQAVQNSNVYNIPKAPFAWIDRPKGVNRIIGIKWAGSIIYPEIYGEFSNDMIKDFYKTFYHINITDEQIEKLLSI